MVPAVVSVVAAAARRRRGLGVASYYIPHAGWYPIGVAASSCMLMVGLGFWLNDLKGGHEPTRIVFYLGAIALTVVLFAWFAKVIEENLGGLTSPQLHRSYIWAMSWSFGT